MPATTDYSTGFGRHEIYRLQQAATEGSVQVYSSGTKAIFGEGAKQEMKSGSTLHVESGALLNIAGELEMKAGSTLNVEAGAAINFAAGGIERASIVTYTCSTMKMNTWDRYAIVRSSDPHSNGTSDNCWTLPHPQDAKKGIIKTIWFESPKGDTHTLAIRTTSVKIGFNSTNRHCIYAGATNPQMITTGGNVGVSVTMIAASSSIWRIMSPMTTDNKVGKLQLTSSTECTL